MKRHPLWRFILFFFLTGVFLVALFTIDAFRSNNSVFVQKAHAQTHQKSYIEPYWDPHEKPGFKKLVKIQLKVIDDIAPDGPKILKVEFGGRNIALKPADTNGNRGTTHFKINPGTYTVKWIVHTSNFDWPRSTSYQENVTVPKNDTWMYIIIEGDYLSIQ